MKDFRKLQVWEKAHQLALTLYHVTASFPRDENLWPGVSDSSGGIFNPGG